ncbi:hypothetical protein CO172_01535 [Candidatus Uhrbacteria bacterium CG_4_9_14_3_um_filter_36_7]|uniref:Serine hydrolase family protein n=1 Tax=Candidatus Uhrbacteria bacterium CG_4_9_14_3_um_filter_36_7 TaxID=1975033 RepID=A0A2M7XHT0_9BACT|nr:MAG: hypothetical protein CO172_01535 [Candidatus Uhrbacteria bacterium CG_4_9_14_3_um_filter_36_7]
MANIFVFHGVGGHPKENWFPWLKEKFELEGHSVFIPQFPTPENQTLDSWMQVLKKYGKYINEDAILVGHSLGVPFTLNVIEKYPVKAAFLVAGFIGKAENEFDEGMKTFAQRDFDWSTIRKNCKSFKIYHSDNDPYLSLDKAKRISNKLNVEINLIKNAGHFNEASGYTEFEVLLADIKSAISNPER